MKAWPTFPPQTSATIRKLCCHPNGTAAEAEEALSHRSAVGNKNVKLKSVLTRPAAKLARLQKLGGDPADDTKCAGLSDNALVAAACPASDSIARGDSTKNIDLRGGSVGLDGDDDSLGEPDGDDGGSGELLPERGGPAEEDAAVLEAMGFGCFGASRG